MPCVDELMKTHFRIFSTHTLCGISMRALKRWCRKLFRREKKELAAFVQSEIISNGQTQQVQRMYVVSDDQAVT